MNPPGLKRKGTVVICVLLFTAGCSIPSPTPTPTPTTIPPIPTRTPKPAPSSTPTPSATPTQESEASISDNGSPLIYDDDGSPDGTVALLYLLSHPDVDLLAVNLSYGEVYPEVYIQHLGRVMDAFGFPDVLLGYGPVPSQAGRLDFPEFLRQSSNEFWGLSIPNADKTYPAQDAAELIISVLRQSSEPVTLFVAGPCTNLAQALRLDPDIRNYINAVYIMGGAVYVPGNIHDFYPEHENVYAEWNIVADPQAAREVFESGLEIYLVPLDATNQVLITSEDTSEWRNGDEIADLAADFYDWLLRIWPTDEAAIWDLMTAVAMLQPELCPFTPLHLQVITEQGSTLGQTAVLPDEAPNIYVCLDPDADRIRQDLIDVFSRSR